MQSRVIRRAPDVASELSGERVVILSADARYMTTLSPTGAFVWSLLTEDRTVAELTAALHERFPTIDASVVHNDVSDLVDELSELGLVCVEPPTEPVTANS